MSTRGPFIIGTVQADGTVKVTIPLQYKSRRAGVIRIGFPVELTGTFQRIDIPNGAPAFFLIVNLPPLTIMLSKFRAMASALPLE